MLSQNVCGFDILGTKVSVHNSKAIKTPERPFTLSLSQFSSRLKES